MPLKFKETYIQQSLDKIDSSKSQNKIINPALAAYITQYL